MPIPSLDENGLLPDGIHDCTLAELKEAFGKNRWVVDTSSESYRERLCPQRRSLFEVLERYLGELRAIGFVDYVLVDGSFVTDKPDPNDVDLIVVFAASHDFNVTLPPPVYDLVSNKQMRRHGDPFHVYFCHEGDAVCQSMLTVFRRVRKSEDLRKGLLKVKP
jgi:hypothetical protein